MVRKAYDSVSSEQLWYCMRRLRVAEKHVRLVKDVYEDREVQGGDGVPSGIFSELLLVCSADGQTDRWGQTVVSLDYDVCSQHCDLQ